MAWSRQHPSVDWWSIHGVTTDWWSTGRHLSNVSFKLALFDRIGSQRAAITLRTHYPPKQRVKSCATSRGHGASQSESTDSWPVHSSTAPAPATCHGHRVESGLTPCPKSLRPPPPCEGGDPRHGGVASGGPLQVGTAATPGSRAHPGQIRVGLQAPPPPPPAPLPGRRGSRDARGVGPGCTPAHAPT